MKVKNLMWIMLGGLLLTCPATAEEKKRATVIVKEVEGSTQIIIKPVEGYKWNALYPAKIKFSVCSETSCVFYTEDLVVEEEK